MPDNISRSLQAPLYLKRKIVIALVLIIVFVITLEIWVSNRVSTFGEKINGLESTRYSLQLENDYIKNQIAQKKSLKLNQKKSTNLGFEKSKKFEYMKVSPIALNPNKYTTRK